MAILAVMLANNSNAYVELDITGLRSISPAYDSVLVERQNPDGSFSTVRGADTVSTGGVDEFIVFDYECPLGLATAYQVTAIRHNGDGSLTDEIVIPSLVEVANVYAEGFESGVPGTWSATNGTLASDTGTVFDGTKSLKLTSTANGAFSANGPSVLLPDPTLQYDLTAWVRSPQTLTVTFEMDFYSANDFTYEGYTSSSLQGTTVTLAANTWTRVKLSSGLLPANTGRAHLIIGTTGGTAGNVLDIDDVRLDNTPSGSAITLTPPTDKVWLKSMANPTLSMALEVSSVDDAVYAARQQVNPIIGAKFPVVISDVQGARTGSITFHTYTLTERAQFRELFELGATLLFQGDSGDGHSGDGHNGDGFEDMYFMVGDVTEHRPSGSSRDPQRTWIVQFTEVDSPPGSLTALPGNSWLLVTSFGDWNTVNTDRTSWLDVLNTPFGS